MNLKRTLSRLRFRSVLRRQKTVPLHACFNLWAASDAAYTGPVGFGAKLFPEAEAIDRVTVDPAISIEDLLRGADHENPKVSASCIEALFRRKAGDRLTQSVAKRQEKI